MIFIILGYFVPESIMVGLSGGVDSAVTAALLKSQGYDVTTCFMRNWRDHHGQCQDHQELRDAKAIADQLSLPFEVIDLSAAYWDEVFQHFLDELAQNRTPNPDIYCNSQIKFHHFWHHCQQMGMPQMATGHYASIKRSESGCFLQCAADHFKDQTYFLYRLTAEQLSRSQFPLGAMHKQAVRDYAASIHLPVSDKKDSTGICFIGEQRFKDFLKHYLLDKPGDIMTLTGQVIGQHEGLMFYTIGQRKGLHIGGHASFGEKPWYVLRKSITDNALIVVQGDDPLMYSHALVCEQVHWVNKPPGCDIPLMARYRHQQALQACHIAYDGDVLHVDFDQKQRAVTPGQHIVFYHKDICLGGGVIQRIK